MASDKYTYGNFGQSDHDILKDCLGEEEDLIKKCLHIINDIEPYGNVLINAIIKAYEKGMNDGKNIWED